MSKGTLLASLLLLTLPGLWALGQGYTSMPADALIYPLGVEGTDYADMEQDVRGGTLYVAVRSDPKSWNHAISAETSTRWFTNRMHHGLLSYNPNGGGTVLDLAKGREISEPKTTLSSHFGFGRGSVGPTASQSPRMMSCSRSMI